MGILNRVSDKTGILKLCRIIRKRDIPIKRLQKQILKLHIFFKESGIKEGDKIALVGRNSANWCMIYLATVTYGAVIVPILPDFKPEDLINLINHSDSRLLFVDDKIYETLDSSKMTGNRRGYFT